MRYRFGDIALVEFPQSGTVIRKKRPAVVVLDTGDADVVLAPITTKERSGPGDCSLQDWSDGGLLRRSWVRLAKVACLEKRTILRRLGQFSENDRSEIAATWRRLYALQDDPRVAR